MDNAAGALAEIEAAHVLLRDSRDPALAAASLMAVSIDALTRIGGREAAAAVLVGQLRRLHAGQVPESQFAPGHA